MAISNVVVINTSDVLPVPGLAAIPSFAHNSKKRG